LLRGHLRLRRPSLLNLLQKILCNRSLRSLCLWSRVLERIHLLLNSNKLTKRDHADLTTQVLLMLIRRKLLKLSH
jgi:hypothetical protein